MKSENQASIMTPELDKINLIREALGAVLIRKLCPAILMIAYKSSDREIGSTCP